MPDDIVAEGSSIRHDNGNSAGCSSSRDLKTKKRRKKRVWHLVALIVHSSAGGQMDAGQPPQVPSEVSDSWPDTGEKQV